MTTQTPKPYPSYADWMASESVEQWVVERRSIGKYASQLFLMRQDFAFDDPATPDLSIQMCTNGRIRFDADLGFRPFSGDCRVGKFIVTVPNRVARIKSDGQPFELLTISIPWQELRPVIERSVDRELPHLSEEIHSQMNVDPKVWQLTQLMWDEALDSCPSSELTFQGLQTALIGRLLKLSHIPTIDKQPPKLSADQLGIVHELMLDSIETGVELDDLASAVDISRFHFCRLFKTTTGKTAGRYLIQLRVEKAKQLLRDDKDKSLASVALECGFSDQAHFTRHFRDSTSMTPEKYRKQS